MGSALTPTRNAIKFLNNAIPAGRTEQLQNLWRDRKIRKSLGRARHHHRPLKSNFDGIGQVVGHNKGRTGSSKRTDAADRGRSIVPALRDRLRVLSATIILLAATSTGAIAQEKYDPGATDTEIKIGNIM